MKCEYTFSFLFFHPATIMDTNNPTPPVQTFRCAVCYKSKPLSELMTRHLVIQLKKDLRCITGCCAECALLQSSCPRCNQCPVIMHNTEEPFVWRCVSKAGSRSYSIVNMNGVKAQDTPFLEYLQFIAGSEIPLTQNISSTFPVDCAFTGGEMYTFGIK